MKKLFYLLALTSCFAIGQTKAKPKFKNTPRLATQVEQPADTLPNNRPLITSTSLDEYNYMTKGFRIEEESGLDRKKGYDIDMLKIYDADLYNFEFIILKRSKNSVAGIIVKALDKKNNKLYYLGIPINDDELSSKYFSSVRAMGSDMVYYYSQISSSMIAPLVYGLYSVK